ncbi:MAG TPA: fibronectin type III domain-containing protein [Candidatus Saccharimonadales bacterium]|nr:fibronectin type III domain-containing protein [Candidatus Saccharimonadales bacterium]
MKAKTLTVKMVSGSAVVCLLMSGLCSCLSSTVYATAPIAITTCQQLQDMDNDLTASYVLAQDIDCYGSGAWNSGAGFSPIGLAESGAAFTGSFDGQGHTVYGLTIDRSTTSPAGLFYIIQGTTVQSVNLVDASISGTDTSGTLAAGIIDSNISDIHIEQSAVSTAGSAYTGGLAGYDYANGGDVAISGSWFSGTVNGFADTGGLVGYMSFVNVVDSYSTGTVTGTSNVGGLVGEFQDFWGINNTFSQAAVVASGNDAGGLVGQLGDGLHGAPFIFNSYASGSVTSSADAAGGLVGLDIAAIDDSFGAGAVSAPSATNVGGFVGIYSSGDSNNNVYDQLRTGQASCAGGGSCGSVMANVTAVNTAGSPNSSYFFNDLSNAPLSGWDTSVWVTKASGFPVFARLPHDVTVVSNQPSSNAIQVGWQPPADSDTPDVTGYTLRYRLADLSNSWTTISVPASAHPSYTITGLQPNTQYSIVIITNNAVGASSGTGIIAKTAAAPAVISNSQTHVINSSNKTSSTDDTAVPDTSLAPVTTDYFGGYPATGYTADNLQVGSVVHFQIVHNSALAKHTATIRELGDDYVVLTIASTPFDVRLNVGQTKDVSVDRNGRNTLQITLQSITNGTANVTFKALTAQHAAAITKTAHAAHRTIWLWFGVAALVATGSVVLYSTRKRSAQF